ncbi:AAA family ATPase [Listeria booriae]|nr:AAA family ATPase [Listeria booriae]
MRKIRMKNFRSFKDTGFIELSPLTVFVGKNGVGKSSLLRFFPLIQQTLSTSTNEPILWYSKNSVDFGGFQQSIYRHSEMSEKKNKISFEFIFDTQLREDRIFQFGWILNWESYMERSGYRDERKAKKEFRVELEIGKKVISQSRVCWDENELLIKLDGDKYNLYLDNEQLDFGEKMYIKKIKDTGFIPYLGIEGATDNESISESIELIAIINLVNLVKKKSDKRIKTQYLSDFFREVNFNTREVTLSSLKEEASKSGRTTLKRYFDSMKLGSEEYDRIYKLLVMMYLPSIIETVNDYIKSYFDNINYIAPLRANAERYYRTQGLAIKKIDSMGTNVPMFLYHLTQQEKRYKEWQNWTKDKFGFQFEVESSEGHVSMSVVDGDFRINLADTGFGYSQILPIILLLWQVMTSRSAYNKNEIISLVIEQPELHLHPSMQSKLLDAFVTLVNLFKKKQIEVKFILETHSETIINRIGYQIETNELFEAGDVNINIVDFKDNLKTAEVTSVKFNENGILEKWPIGFFDGGEE